MVKGKKYKCVGTSVQLQKFTLMPNGSAVGSVILGGDDEEIARIWSPVGKAYSCYGDRNRPSDLEEVEERVRGWVNYYEDGTLGGRVHETQEEAKLNQDTDCLGQIYIDAPVIK